MYRICMSHNELSLLFDYFESYSAHDNVIDQLAICLMLLLCTTLYSPIVIVVLVVLPFPCSSYPPR